MMIHYDDEYTNTIHDAVLEMIVKQRLPLAIVVSDSFRELMRRVSYGSFRPETMDRFLDRLHQKSMEANSTLASKLESAVALSFTVDGWTSMRRHYIAISVHFITRDGKLETAILPLQFVPCKVWSHATFTTFTINNNIMY